MMSLALNVGNWWETCGHEIWATNPRRSNFIAQGHKCDCCGGNQAWVVYQLSLFSDYLRHCGCFEELDQLAFHQNYSHYFLKSQSAYLYHTYLLPKRKFILFFFKISLSNNCLYCLSFTIANFFYQQLTSRVVLRKFHQVTSGKCIYCTVDSVMILKVNN